MSLLVSGIATFRATGLVPNFAGLWTSAWLTAWMVAFPVVLIVAPFVRQMVELVISRSDGASGKTCDSRR